MNNAYIARSISYAGIVVNISTNSSFIDEYLRKFLSPFFCEVILKADFEPIAKITITLTDDIPTGTRRRTVLIRDSHSESGRYKGYEEFLDGKRIINLGCTSIVFSAKKSIDIYSADIDELKKYSRLAIRDIVQKEFERRGGVTLHASSVYDDEGNSICILGNKGSGKTTILLEYVINRHYRHGGLDRVMIRQEGDKIITYGWPLLYNIGMVHYQGSPN
jgi:hypothetical protein